MTYIYTPTIVTCIPSDIPTDRHDEIEQKLDAARINLRKVSSFSRSAAMDAACWELSRSGCGACGIAKVTRKVERR